MSDNLFHTDNRPFIIAGPCSVESHSQLIEITAALQATRQVDMIRCGVWKPRTRPGGFGGLGEPVLEWLSALRRQYPEMRFCCEVAQPEHVELCLRHGIDAVWIGARTSGNPFSVDELAQALRGCNIGVMVKNPIAADVNLWQGSIERIMQADVPHVAAIHRGFFLYHDGCPYRNKPLWEVAIELQRRMPDLPLFCDPSHMGGHRRYLKELMTTAGDLGCNGYMVEVHPHPESALTDSDQQIDVATLEELLAYLEDYKQADSVEMRLNTLRQQIDAIDERLIRAMGDRMEISRKIAHLKMADHLKAYQPQRWNELLRQRLTTAQSVGLDPHFVRKLYEAIHEESIRTQEEIMGNVR